MFVQIAPHEERIFSLTRLAWGVAARWIRCEAFRGNYAQRDVMQQIRTRHAEVPRPAGRVRNMQSFNIGGGNYDIDFVIRGPELEALAEFAERLRQQAPKLGLHRRRHDAQAEQAGAARADRPRPRRRPRRPHRRTVAAALRLMVGGDQEVSRFRDPTVNEDYDVQLRLGGEDRGDPDTIARLYVARDNGELVRLDCVVTLEEGRSPSRVDRIDRQRQVTLRAGIAPGLRAGRPPRRRCAHAAAELGMPAAYSTAVAGRGPRAGTHLRRVRLGVPALDHLHVHGAGGAVREPAQPVHHPARRCRCRCRSRCCRSTSPATR